MHPKYEVVRVSADPNDPESMKEFQESINVINDFMISEVQRVSVELGITEDV